MRLRKKVLQSAAYFMLIAALTLQPLPAAVAEEPAGLPYPQQISGEEEISEKFKITYEKAAETADMVLYADKEKGHFALQNKKTGKIWYSTPNCTETDEVTQGVQLMDARSEIILHYVLKETESGSSDTQSANSQSGAVSKGNVDVTLTENGMNVLYSFESVGIKIPVKYELKNGSFTASIDVGKIEEGESAYLVRVDLLPYFGAEITGENGYLFIPDGSGALIDFSQHIQNPSPEIILPIYGEEMTAYREKKATETEKVYLPVFGTVAGNDALMGVVTEGDAQGSILAHYGCDSFLYNSVGTSLNYRYHYSKTLFKGQGKIQSTLYKASRSKTSVDKYAVEYSLLDGEDASYTGIAKKYREKLFDGGKKAPEPAFNVTLYGAARITDSFFGITYTKLQRLTAFNQAEEIMRNISDKGISSLYIRYKGWNSGGILNKKVPTAAAPLSKLGGKKAFKKLLQYAEKENIPLSPDVDILSAESSSGAVRDVFYDRVPVYGFQSSTYYINKEWGKLYFLSLSSVNKAYSKFIKSYSGLSDKRISLSSLGNTVYSDFSKNAPADREEMKNNTVNILKNTAVRNIALESANAYAAVYAEKIFDVPMFSSGYDVYKTDVPFYQIAMHGSVGMTTEPIGQSHNPAVTFLKAVETGTELHYNGIYADSIALTGTKFESLYSSTAGLWLDEAAERQKAYDSVLNKIYDKKITGHTEIKNGIFKTDYEGGISVIVNYTDSDYCVDGEVICKPHWFGEVG